MNNFKVREMVQRHRAALMATVTAMLCTAMITAPAMASEITTGVTQGLGKIWEIFTGIALPVAAIALAACGVSVIIGNERSTESAKKTAIRIVVGIVIIMLAPTIVNAMGSWFGKGNWSFNG